MVKFKLVLTSECKSTIRLNTTIIGIAAMLSENFVKNRIRYRIYFDYFTPVFEIVTTKYPEDLYSVADGIVSSLTAIPYCFFMQLYVYYSEYVKDVNDLEKLVEFIANELKAERVTYNEHFNEYCIYNYKELVEACVRHSEQQYADIEVLIRAVKMPYEINRLSKFFKLVIDRLILHKVS